MLKNIDIWGPSLLRHGLARCCRRVRGTKHILFCVTDHFEPRWLDASEEEERARVTRWQRMFPPLAERNRDSNNRPIQHTWFYAVEQYNSDLVESMSGLCRKGYGELELHLHHAHDTADGLREKLETAKEHFSRHGAFTAMGEEPQNAFGFIHGNWALNNSRHGTSMCGVDNELGILREAGCYADFSLPSAPLESQTTTVNSIYYARDISGRRKSHDRGVRVRVEGMEEGDLMLIQGPLALNWRQRKFGILPRIDNGCIQASFPGTPQRVDLWIRQHIHVKGRPEWIFVRVYCHGAQESDTDALLGDGAAQIHTRLREKYNDGVEYCLHYVTAREMFNIAKAAEAGMHGNPFQFRNYLIPPYRNSADASSTSEQTAP